MKTIHKIRSLRNEKKISEKEMSEFIGISQNTYSLIESGKSKLKLEHLEKIAEKLNVDLFELIDGHNNNFDVHDNTIQNGGQQNINTQNTYTYFEKEIISLLKDQNFKKDEQINELLNIIKIK